MKNIILFVGTYLFGISMDLMDVNKNIGEMKLDQSFLLTKENYLKKLRIPLLALKGADVQTAIRLFSL